MYTLILKGKNAKRFLDSSGQLDRDRIEREFSSNKLDIKGFLWSGISENFGAFDKERAMELNKMYSLQLQNEKFDHRLVKLFQSLKRLRVSLDPQTLECLITSDVQHEMDISRSNAWSATQSSPVKRRALSVFSNNKEETKF